MLDYCYSHKDSRNGWNISIKGCLWLIFSWYSHKASVNTLDINIASVSNMYLCRWTAYHYFTECPKDMVVHCIHINFMKLVELEGSLIAGSCCNGFVAQVLRADPAMSLSKAFIAAPGRLRVGIAQQASHKVSWTGSLIQQLSKHQIDFLTLTGKPYSELLVNMKEVPEYGTKLPKQVTHHSPGTCQDQSTCQT